MVSRAAAGRSRRAAFRLGLGVAVAATVWAAAACFGMALAMAMARYASLYRAVQIVGGLYLFWLGVRAWRTKPGLAETGAVSARSAGLRRGILTGAALNLGNPKIVIFFTSIFVVLLPASAPLWVRLAATAIVGAQEAAWYILVATLFARPRAQAAYRRAGVWIERVVGTVLFGIGADIVVASVKSGV